MKKLVLIFIISLSIFGLVGCENNDYYTKEEVDEIIKQIESNNLCYDNNQEYYTKSETNIIVSELQQHIDDID